MRQVRLIARLDIKAPNLIKGIQLEGLRVLGDPNKFARRYYETGADEIICMDIVASLYERNNLAAIIEKATRDVFIPITVGGGVRSEEDARSLLRAGADKVAINTAAVRNPDLIGKLARTFGSQCTVLSIEAKQTAPGRWEAYTNNGREHTGLDVIDWARRGAALGAGEIILTSVDREGTRKGFDVELVKAVCDVVEIPVIASGGMGMFEHLRDVVEIGHADAVAMADVLHHNRMTFPEIRMQAQGFGLAVRSVE